MARQGENIRKRKDGRWEGRYPVYSQEKGRNIYRSYSEPDSEICVRSVRIHHASPKKVCAGFEEHPCQSACKKRAEKADGSNLQPDGLFQDGSADVSLYRT